MSSRREMRWSRVLTSVRCLHSLLRCDADSRLVLEKVEECVDKLVSTNYCNLSSPPEF